jgi:hypothetical protein
MLTVSTRRCVCARCVVRAQFGNTPLHCAASCHVSIATLLLERGANKEAKNVRMRNAHAPHTPQRMAARTMRSARRGGGGGVGARGIRLHSVLLRAAARPVCLRARHRRRGRAARRAV